MAMSIKLLESAYEHFLRVRSRGLWIDHITGGWYHSNAKRDWDPYINRMPSEITSYIKERLSEFNGKRVQDINLRERTL